MYSKYLNKTNNYYTLSHTGHSLPFTSIPYSAGFAIRR